MLDNISSKLLELNAVDAYRGFPTELTPRALLHRQNFGRGEISESVRNFVFCEYIYIMISQPNLLSVIS